MSRRTRRQTRREAVKQKNRLGYFLIFLAACFVIAAAWFYATASSTKVDKATFCPTDLENANGITSVIVDTTDELSPVQKEALINELNTLQASMSRYERLEVFEVGHIVQKTLTPIFSICNPGRGKAIDPLLGNPVLVEKKWQRGFRGPLEDSLRNSLGKGSANTSPIIESIQSVLVTSIARYGGLGKKRLLIASDMLQHSSLLSHYNSAISFSEFKSSSHYQSAFADMRGVEFSILYFRREGMHHKQGRSHIDFWESYISSHGGVLVQVKKL